MPSGVAAALAPSPAASEEHVLGRRRPLQRSEPETAEECLDRMGTCLMGRYRDTRDPRVFESLYELSRSSVLSWIKSLLGRELSCLDPGDLLQDTFVNVYRYPGSFREEHDGSFRVWVRTIAGNVVRRSSAARTRLDGHEWSEELAEVPDRNRGPAEAIERAEQMRRLRGAWILFLCHYARAWSDLSQRDRRTLHLVEVEGLSYEEVGRILAVGRSNLKMIVFRSRRRIARHMRLAMSRAGSRLERAAS